MKKPALVLIRGLPGSGKSFLAEELASRLGRDGVVLLDPDQIGYESEEYKQFTRELSEDGVEEKFHPFRFSRERASQGIKENKIIIWTQAFTLLSGFQRLTNFLQGYALERGKELPVLVVEVSVNPETAKARIAERASSGGHDVPAENFDRFISEYRSFSSEGFHTIDINGDGDVNMSVDAVLSELEKL